LQLDDWQRGAGDISIRTESSTWTARLELAPEKSRLEWVGNLQEGPSGQLFDFHLNVTGSVSGFYEWGEGDSLTKFFPNFSRFQLNQINLINLSGEVVVDEYRLFATSLKAKGLEVKGGLYFPPEGRTQFSELTW